MTRTLSVSLGDTLVGHLREEDGGRASFRLDQAYRARIDRPVLGQVFEDEPQRTFVEKQGVPRWFANLLPEVGPLRSLLCEGLRVDPDDALSLLEVLGEDLPGAVVVRPGDAPDGAPMTIPGEVESDSPVAPSLRFSLAGVQLKLSMLMAGDRLTLPAPGQFGNAILKLTQGDVVGIAENEACMMAWARAGGFEAAPARLIRVPDLGIRSHVLESIHATGLAVERFDRVGGERVHQEDFAQVTSRPPSGKYDHVTYEQLGAVVLGVLGGEGFREYVRRLALVIAQGNADAHLKNWSLRYGDPSRPAWSPLYDQVFTRAWPQFDGRLALKFAGVRQFGQIDLGDFERLAVRAGYTAPDVKSLVLTTIETLRDAIVDLPERAALRPEHATLLADHWRSVPLLRRVGALPA